MNYHFKNLSIRLVRLIFIRRKESNIVSTVLSTNISPTYNTVQSLNLENKKCTSSAYFHSGRSVNEISERQEDIATYSIPLGKGRIKNEPNKNHSEIIDMQWQSHCQFYSECSHCLRLQAKPSIDDATQPIVIINTSESCSRIKPKRNVQRRVFVELLTTDNQELIAEEVYFSSRMASTSTGTPFGNSLTPIAARAG